MFFFTPATFKSKTIDKWFAEYLVSERWRSHKCTDTLSNSAGLRIPHVRTSPVTNLHARRKIPARSAPIARAAPRIPARSAVTSPRLSLGHRAEFSTVESFLLGSNYKKNNVFLCSSTFYKHLFSYLCYGFCLLLLLFDTFVL